MSFYNINDIIINIRIDNAEKLKYYLSKNDYSKYVDSNGKTLLHKAVYFGSIKCAKVILEKFKDSNILDVKCDRKLTCLQTLCRDSLIKENVEFLNLLLEYGANPLIKDDIDDSLALHIAFKNGNLEYGKILLQFSNINEVDNYGNTCLHLASNNLDFNCIKYLIDKGIDYEIISKKGFKAIDFIKMFNTKECEDMYLNCLKIKDYELITLCAEKTDNKYNEYKDNIDDFTVILHEEILTFLY